MWLTQLAAQDSYINNIYRINNTQTHTHISARIAVDTHRTAQPCYELYK